jgi:hypothetical protein
MKDQSSSAPCAARPVSRLPAALVLIVLALCWLYANLALTVTDPADYRFFPPFQPYFNAYQYRRLGGENYEIAKSMLAGQGYANPFKESTGPTAWTAPVGPLLTAGLLWLFDRDQGSTAAVMSVWALAVLMATGLLVLKIAARSAPRLSPWLVAGVFLVFVLRNFFYWFQTPSDGWRVLLALDGLLLGGCVWRPLERWPAALAWGLFGGFCALLSPVVGFTWGILIVTAGVSRRHWRRLGIALLAAGLTVTPWVIRNYLVFGRLIPVKSNMAYELYQSQCMQADGLLQQQTFDSHPHTVGGPERQQYQELGEPAYLDEKWRQVCRSVVDAPLGFVKRVADRLLGATVWYVPLNRVNEMKRPVVLWPKRATHVFPFLALVALLALLREPLKRCQWTAIAIYGFHLLPYVIISYYERYALPLLGVNVLLIVWALDRLPGRLAMDNRSRS